MMTTLLTGLAIGGIYAIVAMQYDLVYTATGIFNFAQASFVLLGSFMIYTLVQEQHWPVVLAVILAAAAVGVVALIQERLTIRPMQRSERLRLSHVSLLTTLGVASIVEGAMLTGWGSDPVAVPFPGSDDSIELLGGRVLPVELTLVVTAIVLTAIARLVLTRTRMGVTILATARDRNLAMIRGINVQRVSTMTFVTAGVLSGLSAILIAPVIYATYNGGHILIVACFAALAIGGFATQTGALVGGLLIGVIQSFAGYWFAPDHGMLAVLGFLLLVLLVRPAGLFGAPEGRAV